MKIKSVLSKLLLVVIILATLISLYIYSRCHVDDAFITWRYGKNLIEHGVWGYNNSSIDPTQAYTNPIFAILGIIPPLMKWDVVLFFKIVSVIIYVTFLIWTIQVTKKSWHMTLLLFGLPATVIHAFSGLETLLFVFLVSVLLVALHRRQFSLSIVVTLILFLTRPESWSLGVALPLFWLFVCPENENTGESLKPRIRRVLICALILGIFFSIYFAWHIYLFGSALPNTFYVKSGGEIKLGNIIRFLIFASPLLLIFRLRYWPLLGVAAILFGGMILTYSTSQLMMNYASRFAFHIFAPSYVFGLYLIYQNNSDGYFQKKSTCKVGSTLGQFCLIKPLLLAVLIVFTFDNKRTGGFTEIITWYPRYLTAHAELGRTIKAVTSKYELKGFSCADAGMIAYHADIVAFDNVGLASARLARGESIEKLFSVYDNNIIIINTRPTDGLPIMEKFHQKEIFKWMENKKFKKVGDLHSIVRVPFAVYANRDMPEIAEVLKVSRQKNDITDEQMLKETLLLPPWTYWHE